MRTLGRSLGSLAALIAAGLVSLVTLADAPAGRYTISGGTVFDSKTKLTWQQTPSSTGYTLADAKSYCASLGTTLGGTGWRVPTVKELVTLIDHSRASPAIDPTAFPSLPSNDYWTSTASAYSSGIFVVEFGHGFTLSIPASSASRRVLCVR